MLADGVQTLKEDIEVVAFLPGASYVFLLISPGGDKILLFILAILAAIVGSAFYNYLNHLKSDEKKEDASGMEEEKADNWNDPRETTNEADNEDTVAGVLIASWGGLLLVSMYFLYGLFSKNWILPEILFFISVGVIALYFTEGVLRYILTDYGE
jgi:uncharacterized ion transporter superfamily protein YfcC